MIFQCDRKWLTTVQIRLVSPQRFFDLQIWCVVDERISCFEPLGCAFTQYVVHVDYYQIPQRGKLRVTSELLSIAMVICWLASDTHAELLDKLQLAKFSVSAASGSSHVLPSQDAQGSKVAFITRGEILELKVLPFEVGALPILSLFRD